MISKELIAKLHLNKSCQFACGSFLLGILTANVGFTETINSIVATVESQSITDYDLKKSPLKKSPDLLDQEIFARLIKLDAKRNGLTTNTEEVNFYLKQIAYNQGFTTEELLQQQKAKGLSPDAVRAEVELEVLKQKLAMKLFQNSKSSLNQKQESDIAKVNLSQIIIDQSKHEESETKELVKKIEAGYENGQTFELLVEDFSDAIDKKDKGLLGELDWKDLDPNFRTELEKISVGELTAPIKKGSLIFIFKLNQITSQEEASNSDEPEQELSPAEINSLLREYFSKELYKNYLIDKK